MSGLTMVPLFEDELLTSFISRLARANGRQRSRTFCLDLGLSPLLIERGDDEEIARLSRLVPIPVERLLSRAVKLGKNDGAFIAGAYFPKRSLLRRKLRFCPKCLKQDDADQTRMPGTRMYYRSEWMIPAIQSCPRHDCTIVQSYEPTYHSHAYDFLTLLELAEDSMDSIVERSVEQPVTPFERFVSDRMAGKFIHGALLDDLSLSTAIDICELFGIATLFGKKCRLTSVSQRDTLRAANHAYDALKLGHEGLYALLDQMKADISASNSRGGQAMYGRLYNALNEGHEGADYDKVRKLIRDYSIATVPILNGSDFFGKIDNSPWTSVNVVVKATGNSDQTVRRLLFRLGHLETERPSKGEQFITRIAADEAIHILDEGVIGSDAAKIVGCLEPYFWNFVDDGRFEPMLMSRHEWEESDYAMRTRFSRSKLIAFRQRLDDAVTLDVAEGMLSLPEVAKLQGERHSTILNLILQGKLASVAMKQEGHLPSSVMLFSTEVAAALGRSGLTTSETRERLGIKHHVLRALVDQKYLNPKTFGAVKSLIFDEVEVEDFQSQFVSLGMLVKETGIPKGELMARLKRIGETPAFQTEQIGAILISRKMVDRLVRVAS